MTTKKGVIYIRVSTSDQSDTYAPDGQEADCRKRAQEEGIEVVAVYRDVQRYRTKTKWVEPSGRRADRPGLLAMLEDAKQGQFDVILAFREDRLYRGMRPMLLVLETIQEHKIDIILAKETFDMKIAPLKAWVAGMEIDGMRERVTMGKQQRLREGKAIGGFDRFGYRRNGEVIEVVEEEASWVIEIFEWYLGGVSYAEMRRRLIDAGVPPNRGSKIRWGKSSLECVLNAAEYATGIKIYTYDGETFEIPIPAIITMETWEAAEAKRIENKKNPTGPLKNDYLIRGLLYCDCGLRWRARTMRSKNKSGVSIYGAYYCPRTHHEMTHENCPYTIGAKKADIYVWEKVCEAIQQPDILLHAAREYIDGLRTQEGDQQAEIDRLQNELDSLTIERQQIITWARKGRISEEDMEYQLTNLTLQELDLKKELASIGSVKRLTELADWERATRKYLDSAAAGLEQINEDPLNPKYFGLKRDVVTTFVERICIDRDRHMAITFKLDILSILSAQNAPIESTCCRR